MRTTTSFKTNGPKFAPRKDIRGATGASSNSEQHDRTASQGLPKPAKSQLTTEGRRPKPLCDPKIASTEPRPKMMGDEHPFFQDLLKSASKTTTSAIARVNARFPKPGGPTERRDHAPGRITKRNRDNEEEAGFRKTKVNDVGPVVKRMKKQENPEKKDQKRDEAQETNSNAKLHGRKTALAEPQTQEQKKEEKPQLPKLLKISKRSQDVEKKEQQLKVPVLSKTPEDSTSKKNAEETLGTAAPALKQNIEEDHELNKSRMGLQTQEQNKEKGPQPQKNANEPKPSQLPTSPAAKENEKQPKSGVTKREEEKGQENPSQIPVSAVDKNAAEDRNLVLLCWTAAVAFGLNKLTGETKPVPWLKKMNTPRIRAIATAYFLFLSDKIRAETCTQERLEKATVPPLFLLQFGLRLIARLPQTFEQPTRTDEEWCKFLDLLDVVYREGFPVKFREAS
ncbi:hypothetical protein L596_005860 [Steinernema carpocapsae]|uniref:Uncharacterized protein n=1 Tax=Steinernema carpocapsae TaxID=34508 RepID=A0A4U8V0L1_STECR|nr:hypothetical protein L596_005860 [Steinernema carpocapsae]